MRRIHRTSSFLLLRIKCLISRFPPMILHYSIDSRREKEKKKDGKRNPGQDRTSARRDATSRRGIEYQRIFLSGGEKNSSATIRSTVNLSLSPSLSIFLSFLLLEASMKC